MRSTRRTFLQTTTALAAASWLSRAALAGSMTESGIAADPNRPACHLLPQHNWMNDPNGPIWWKGKCHLFYQLNPHAAVWGDMHWGHAVSTDMVHWHHEAIALAPTPGGPDSEGCFSGSAIVFNGKPAIIYTGVQNAPPEQVTIRDGNGHLRETQMLAMADGDDILHWNKLEQPVIATPPLGMQVTGFRDPCPWKEDDGWYLGVGSGERGKGGCVLLYRSQDLRTWEYLHPLIWGKPNGKQAVNPCDSGEMWECPDFFPLTLPGTSETRHVLIYSTENKVLWTTGHYDRKAHTYTPDRQGVLDQGAAYYAPKSFAAPDGRRILWGWLRETRPEAEFAAAGWAGCMSYPRVLSLGGQGQLITKPAREVEGLRGAVQKAEVTPSAGFRIQLPALQQELRVPVSIIRGETTTVRLLSNDKPAWELTVDVSANEVRCGDLRYALPAKPWPNPELRVFLDGSVLETFVGNREVLTSRVYGLKPGAAALQVEVTGTKTRIETWGLKAISPDRLTT